MLGGGRPPFQPVPAETRAEGIPLTTPEAASTVLDRVLVFTAPADGPAVLKALADAEIPALECDGVSEFCRQMARGAAAAIIAESALLTPDWHRIASALTAQPASEAFPLILLPSVGSRGDLWNLLDQEDPGRTWFMLDGPLNADSLLATLRAVLEAHRQATGIADAPSVPGESVPTLIGYIDGSRRYRFVNRDFEEWFGVRKDQVLGRAAREVSHAISDQGPVPLELTAQLPDGRRRVGLIRLVPHRETPGGTVGHYITIADITALRQAQDTLQIREKHQRAIAALGQSALSSLELDSLLDECVSTVAHILDADECLVLQQPEGEIVLRSAAGRAVDKDHTRVDPGTASLARFTAASQRVVQVDEFGSDPRFAGDAHLFGSGFIAGIGCPIDGGSAGGWGVLLVLSRTKRRFTAEEIGFLESAVTVLSNAIHRVTMEQALRESRQRLALAHVAAGSGAWETDLVTGAQIWSPEMYDLYGIDPDIPRTPANRWEPIHPGDRDRVRDYANQVVNANDEIWSIEFRIIHPRTGVRWIAGFGRVTYTLAGAPLRIVGIDIDITARKTADEQAKRTAAAYALFAGLIQGQEEERRRIARDLHDDFAQRMAVLSMKFEQACAASPSLRDTVGSLQVEMDKISEDLRRLSHQLHPSTLEHFGLAASLQDECDRVAGLRGIPAFADVQGDCESLPKPLQLCVYRIAQEALHNVAKHSGATQAAVLLERTPEHLKLTIEDDGAGFDVDAARARGGLGLSTMEERSRPFHGVFSLASQPGDGTKITVTFPLRFTSDPATP
jgi:PAS domain S-box-containing protein